jgi:Cu/Ag efflux protein CusF
MQKLVIAVGLAIAATTALPVAAQTGAATMSSAPGKVQVADTVKVTATITAIDAKTRDITLKTAEGKEAVVTAGPAVKNFDKLKVGDKVDMQYVEALTLELKKGGGLVVQRTDKSGVAAAKPGEQPAGAIGREVTVVADVIGIDAAKQTITLRGPQRTVDLRVRDPEQFKRIAKGDQVEATFVQAVAIVVDPAAKK